MTDLWLEAGIEAFCTKYAGKRGIPLVETVALETTNLDRIRTAVPLILDAQKVILKHLLKQKSHEQILDLFGVPQVLAPWISVLENPEIDVPMMRVDVLQGVDGNPWICELNIDSSVGGAEAAQFRRIEELRQGIRPLPTPYDDLVSLLGKMLGKINGRKVCIYDWSNWIGYGFFTLDWLQQTLTAGLPGIDVFIATELDGSKQIDKETVVYRMFLSQDACEQPALVQEIFDKAGYVLSDFSGDLMGSKVWMGLLHDPLFRALLKPSALEVIDATTPQTKVIDSTNIDSLLEQKDSWFFKAATDFGGSGTISGRTEDADKIRARLGNLHNNRWIAQRACAITPLLARPLGRDIPMLCTSVLGLYQVGGRWTAGALVRAKAGEDVINVGMGAAFGWGYEVHS